MKRSIRGWIPWVVALAGVLGSFLFAMPPAFGGTLNGPLIHVVNYDRAAYQPGSSVLVYVTLKNTTARPFTGSITLDMSRLGIPIGGTYSQSVRGLSSGDSTTLTFTIQPPRTNYRGYLLSIRALDGSGALLDSAGGAIDVSSDWSKFPRYGYVTEFTAGTDILAIVQALNTYHINGLQFYDVNFQHHRPYSPNSSWPNLSNTIIDRRVVLGLINAAHRYGMKAMDYNLWNGAYADYQTDGSGAQLSWGQFSSKCAPKCAMANQTGYGGWSKSWATPGLMEMNPNNSGWQNLLFNGPQGEVQLLDHLPYDGWHIDTLGDTAIEYDFEGNPSWLGNYFATFTNSAKAAIGNHSVLFNNVGRWSQASMASTANVDFLYSELWQETENYAELNVATKEARTYSSKPIVFPAYMNTAYAGNHRDCADCYFDEASVRLVDDSMLAAGGIHLEMGDKDKMLSSIYWPGKMLRMSSSLEEADLDIANFGVAYENLLRYGVTDIPNSVEIVGAPTNRNGSSGSVWILPKEKAGFQILHLINLAGNTSTLWRDDDATYKAPPRFHNLKVKFNYNGVIIPGTSRLMVASPDLDHGKSEQLPYTTGSDASGNYVQFTLPELYYWDMIYLETSQLASEDYSINPFAQIAAATYDNSSMGGVGVLDSFDSAPGAIVGNACCRRWVEYDDVAFGEGASKLEVRIATAIGGAIEFRLDSPTGPLIASDTIANTNGWQSWRTASLTVNGARGKHNLYMVFPDSAVNVNFFQFSR